MSETEDQPVDLKTPFVKLTADMRKAARTLTCDEARWLIDTYYDRQEDRKSSANRKRAATTSGEPAALIGWVNDAMIRFEGVLKTALGEFAAQYTVGQWIQSLFGFGPVISAAMLASFDIRKAPTVGGFWRFAGLDPTLEWKKGQKRPYNAKLKAICAYRVGETQVKFWNDERCYYGQLMQAKKRELEALNAAGKFSETAQQQVEAATPKVKALDRYKLYWVEGVLAPLQIHARARRWAVKLFLSHLHHVMYRDYHDADPPAPFIFDHPEVDPGRTHTHLRLPPGWPGDFDGKPLRKLLT
jgi:hypothetical protein